MAITDLMARSPSTGIFPGATPALDPLGVAQEAGVRQDTKNKSIDYLMKQLEYSEKQAEAEISGMERTLKKGKYGFDIENQPERLKRDKIQEDIDSEMKLDEQLLRGINNPKTYSRWAAAGVLPKDFYDAQGNPLPYEATSKLRTDMFQRGVMNAEQYRKERLASIQASAAGGGSGFTPTKVSQAEHLAAKDTVKRAIEQWGWDIGDPSDDGSDAENLSWKIAQLTNQIIRYNADKDIKTDPDQVSKKIAEIANKYMIKNPKDAWWKIGTPGKTIQQEQFDSDIQQTFGIIPNYGDTSSSVGTASTSIRLPAFMLMPDGSKITDKDIQERMDATGETFDDIVTKFKLTAPK